MRRWIVFGILLFVTPASADTNKTVRDWQASCDAGLTCRAETPEKGRDAAEPSGYRLQVARKPGTDTGWTVSFISSNFPRPYDGTYLGLSVDGVRIAESKFVAHDDTESFALTDQAALEALFPALRKGNEAMVSVTSDSGGDVSFSLSGLAAVLLWIDEQQDRVGTSGKVTAVATHEPSETIGDLLALPELLYDLLKVTRDCSPVDNDYMAGIGVTRDRLDPETELYSVPCWAAAYNSIERYFIIRNGEVGMLLFADYGDSTGWTGTGEMIGSAYDAETRELSSFAKARGLGDCGSTGRWRWQDGLFRMIEYRFQGECGGEATADPGTWPIVYQAK